MKRIPLSNPLFLIIYGNDLRFSGIGNLNKINAFAGR